MNKNILAQLVLSTVFSMHSVSAVADAPGYDPEWLRYSHAKFHCDKGNEKACDVMKGSRYHVPAPSADKK